MFAPLIFSPDYILISILLFLSFPYPLSSPTFYLCWRILWKFSLWLFIIIDWIFMTEWYDPLKMWEIFSSRPLNSLTPGQLWLGWSSRTIFVATFSTMNDEINQFHPWRMYDTKLTGTNFGNIKIRFIISHPLICSG